MPKVFIATPAFQGKVNVQYAVSLSETVNLLSSKGVKVDLKLNVGGSLLCAERNRLTEAFMETDCTHMLCIDSDLGWQSEAVISMLLKDEDMICGCYPARSGKMFIFRPCYNEDSTLICNAEKQLIKMEYIPAGFMLIKRCVIEKMRNSFPELYFESKNESSISSKGYCLFETKLLNGEFWGEDYIFCSRVKQCGFDIWVDPSIQFDHDGKIGALVEALTNDPDKSAPPPV